MSGLERSRLSPWAVAKKHPIRFKGPAVDFFEGGLLGNGALGAVVNTRPDGVVIRLGHNNVWDVRVAEENREKIGTFRDVFERVRSIPATHASLEEDPWYREYLKITEANYRKPYPRPFPCGSLLLAFDPRRVEVLGHTVDISSGLCRVELLRDGELFDIEVFVEPSADRVWVRAVGGAGRSAASLIERVRLLPDPDTPKEFPKAAPVAHLPEGAFGFQQVLPRSLDGHPGDPALDRAFRVLFRTLPPLARPERLVKHYRLEEMGPLEAVPQGERPFVALLQLEEGSAAELAGRPASLPSVSEEAFEAARAEGERSWRSYWERSGVALEDEFLEALWYRNLYFLHCATKPGVTCPGLWANWSYRGIGTAWHGDYHMNYNAQQPFWVSFCTNHPEKHLAYVEMIEGLLPLSKAWAREYYGLRGAFFPHSAYPVPMSTMPYPVPTWGWEVCETPWAVQSLWWHYLYTMDEEFLANRAFGPLKEAVLFLVDYLTRPEAHGEAWGDDRFHVFPTVPPELYGLMPGFRFNYDCIVDLTLIRFVFKAFLKACAILGLERRERELCRDVREVLSRLPEYPTATAPTGERVFVSVPGEDPRIVYNLPNSTATVFPGEEHGLHSDEESYRIALNSYRLQRNEGSNELILLNVAGARLGALDLERFKRAVEYRLLPNGSCTNMVVQSGGRYPDEWPFDYMKRMGIWFENFALPLVITECLLQSYTGTLRLFPNWPAEKAAEFRTLRAVGGFLVSARFEAGRVQWIEVLSEAGSALSLYNPWEGGARCLREEGESLHRDGLIEVPTRRGERLLFEAAGE